jgi:hypothetical protein
VSGIGKTRLAAALAAEAHREGALVLYASAAGAPGAALDALERLRAAAERRCSCWTTSTAPARRSTTRCRTTWRGGQAMLLAIAPQSTLRADATLRLEPLDAHGVRAVAALYAGTPSDEVPVERLTLEAAACRSACTAPRASGLAKRPPGA